MSNNWKQIWDNRQFNLSDLDIKSVQEIFLELKRCNGFDTIGEGLSYEALFRQYEFTKSQLNRGRKQKIESVYEVGCGSGANLFLFENDGLETGGCDYSQNLVDIAKRVLQTQDIICSEASLFPTDNMYDSVLSNSVFSYFEDWEYASVVLERMCQKVRYSIGILDLHNEEKKEEFFAYREKLTPDYKKRYENLPKLFYKKEFFNEFAEKHNLEIQFKESLMEGYWNNPFVYHCFMYKKV